MKSNEEGSKESGKEDLFAMVFAVFLMLIVPIGIWIPDEISRQQQMAKWRKLPLSERGGYVTKDGQYIPPSYLTEINPAELPPNYGPCNRKVVNPQPNCNFGVSKLR